MRAFSAWCLVSLGVWGVPQASWGDDASQDSPADARLHVAATRVTSSVQIDGILDEPGWQAAEPITDFRLIEVREGQAPSESTQVRVLFDEDHVYFGIWCGNQGPGAIRSSLAPRDQALDDDHIAVHLDTYRDRHRAYIFGVNADGVQLDGILDGDEPDFSWDAVWQAETQRVLGGWVAEIAVPLSVMRFPAGGGGAWGVWFRRQITKNDEVCTWPLWRQAEQGDIMLQAADLTGLDGLRGSGGIEVQPYASMTVAEDRNLRLVGVPPGPVSTEPAGWSKDGEARAGLDLKYDVTSTLTANATVNPDFSQVEADALQIDTNQRFALYYEEKRPFFLEGAETFKTLMNLVYTRRIADPEYGGKLTGKQGPLRLGVIAAMDDGGGSLDGVGAGPQSQGSRKGFVGIARAAYDIGENSHAGVLVTDRESRRTGDVRPLSSGMPTGGRNTVVAADTKTRFSKTFFFDGQLAWSGTRTNAVAGIAPATRYEDVAYDGALRFADGVREVVGYQTYLGPDFRTETGYLERVGIRQTGIESNFIARPENAWLRSWEPILNGYVIHDREGGVEEWWVSPMIDWLFQKQTHMHTMYVRSMERFLGRGFDLNTYIFVLDNSYFRPLALSFEADFGDGIFYDAPSAAQTYRGWSESYEFDATVRPSPRVTSALTVNRNRFSEAFRGAEEFDIWVVGANTTYQFTRRLYARVYPQYDSESEHVDADVLLGYVVSPGTVFYAGYSADFDRIDGRTRGTQRNWFVKASVRLMR